MAVKIRLQRHGRGKRPFYHIVVADSRAPRDGRFIQKLGTYDPMTKPATINIDRDAAIEWLNRGAQPTDTVNAILRYKGVLYYRHLLGGVAKGKFDMEELERRYAEYRSKKDAKIEADVKKVADEREKQRQFIFGKPKPKPVPETPAEITVPDGVAHQASEASREVVNVADQDPELAAAE